MNYICFYSESIRYAGLEFNKLLLQANLSRYRAVQFLYAAELWLQAIEQIREVL